MSDYVKQRPPGIFWTVSLLIVGWSAIGCWMCAMQIMWGADAMPEATDYDRALYAAIPVWYNAVYAVAVGASLLGGIALLARSRIARPLFIVSLIAIVIQFGYLFLTTDLIAVKGAWTAIFPLFIAAVAVAEIWFAGYAMRRGWIG